MNAARGPPADLCSESSEASAQLKSTSHCGAEALAGRARTSQMSFRPRFLNNVRWRVVFSGRGRPDRLFCILDDNGDLHQRQISSGAEDGSEHQL